MTRLRIAEGAARIREGVQSALRTPHSALIAWLLLAACMLGFGPPTLGSGEPHTPSVGSRELAALRAVPTLSPTVAAVAAAILSGSDGHVLAGRNADARLAPASLTKMMTALVALERFPLASAIVATERSQSEPSVIGLDPGDVLSLEHMLYGLMLPSGNDAALAIAETVGEGSIARFVGWMNERAERMGLHNTRFTNPTGLDEPNHYSSARDMGQIATAVMAEPTLARIVGTPRLTVPGPPLYFFMNSNPILSTYPGIEGVKTGFTDDAGRCFAASATRDGRRIIVVVLNSPNIGAESQILLDAGFEMSRRTAVQAARPGFAGVIAVAETGQSDSAGPPTLNLAGWELPLLRAFGTSAQSTISLAGRTIVSIPAPRPVQGPGAGGQGPGVGQVSLDLPDPRPSTPDPHVRTWARGAGTRDA